MLEFSDISKVSQLLCKHPPNLAKLFLPWLNSIYEEISVRRYSEPIMAVVKNVIENIIEADIEFHIKSNLSFTSEDFRPYPNSTTGLSKNNVSLKKIETQETYKSRLSKRLYGFTPKQAKQVPIAENSLWSALRNRLLCCRVNDIESNVKFLISYTHLFQMYQKTASFTMIHRIGRIL